nr:hypothetical protein [Tanacetum cinerariifolium]
MSKSNIVFEEIKMMFQQLMERLNEENQAKIKEMNQVTHTSKPSRRFNSICYDDDDDYDYEESTIPLSDIISQLPSSIVITTSPPVLPTKDPEVSLIIGNEELNTIPEKESDVFIKSSVEDLVPIPSESEDTSESDSEYVLPLCDDFSPINIFKEESVTFSNPLFNSNDDFTSSDDESLSNKDCKDSYDSNLDESTFLVTPLFDSNEDEYFTPGDGVELLLHRNRSTPIMSVVSTLEGFTNEPPLEENDDLFDLEYKENDWDKILYDAPIDGLMFEEEIFDAGIHDQIFSLTYVKDKQEKEKIGTKPDKNGKRGKAQQCRSPITVEKAEKRRNTNSKDQYWQILEVVLNQE